MWCKNPGADEHLRQLERAYQQSPEDQDLKQRWLRERLRLGLPIYNVRIYIELWTEDHIEAHQDPEELELDIKNLKLDSLLELADKLDIQSDNMIGDATWVSSWKPPTQLYEILRLFQKRLPLWIADYDLDAIVLAMEISYIDNTILDEEAIDEIIEAIQLLE